LQLPFPMDSLYADPERKVTQYTAKLSQLLECLVCPIAMLCVVHDRGSAKC